MVKKFLIGLGILAALLLAVNGVVALVPSVREAIIGLPLEDQIFFLANEIDAIKRRQSCQEAEILEQKALDASGMMDAETANDLTARRNKMIEVGVEWRLADFDPLYDQYKSAQANCLGN